MILTNELKGIIVSRGFSQRKVAKMLNMCEKTFYAKMHRGVFDSNEILEMINLLKIENPERIFFADKRAQ